jgi:predicted RecB family endonuclease
MSDIIPYDGGGIAIREARQVFRAISRSRARAEVRMAEADASTDVTLAKVDNLTMATGAAMQQVVRVVRVQRELEQLAPEASARLNFLADDHLLGCSELLSDLRREFRRNR